MDGDMSDAARTLETAAVLEAARRFVERDVSPRVADMERRGAQAGELLDKMRKLGLFGMAVPTEYDGLGIDLETLARLMEIIAQGWTTLAAYLNSHTTVCHIIAAHASEAQKRRYLPCLARGEPRAALCLSESGAGSDLQAIRTRARAVDQGYRIDGGKVFVTNGEQAGLLLVLAKTDPDAAPAHRGMSLFLIEKSLAGVHVGGRFDKMAFEHVDTCEIAFQDAIAPSDALLGETPGKGFGQLLDGLELGRIEFAASAIGLGQAALEHSLRYARERVTFGHPISDHQAVQLELAAMATKLMAARTLTLEAARQKATHGRADMPCAMAKLFASETAMEVALSALRIHGGYGYIKGYAVERLFREAPLYLVGEGTNEIQKLVIARRLLESVA
jgi:alkylation response protein AidB-like acyl-CoA dehydrogenase